MWRFCSGLGEKGLFGFFCLFVSFQCLIYLRKNVHVKTVLCHSVSPQIASTSSVESMPGADGSGALGGVSNLKLILQSEQYWEVGYICFVAGKNNHTSM